MDLIILTGMSGAGKSQAAAFLEDQGYFCIDNLPPLFLYEIVKTFADAEGGHSLDKLAIVVDIRSKALLKDFGQETKKIAELMGITPCIIYLEASDNVLVSRYNQTRRKHPLTDEISLTDAIASERKLLQNIRGRATYIIDTTVLNNAGLKKQLRAILKESDNAGISVFVESFGFMYGQPVDCDEIVDVRFLPNPFWVEELRQLSGRDEPIKEYLSGFEETGEFLKRFSSLFSFILPLYVREGKNRLSIGVGCTGGRHRSVFIAEEIGKMLSDLGYRTNVNHRDIDRDPRYDKETNKR